MDWQSESPELWAFLESLEYGETLTGTVAAIEQYGVFVALDEGPEHPLFPGVGFVTVAELSWCRFAALTEVVQVGQHVSGMFLQFDTRHAEARLSLKALRPDPFPDFAERTEVGQTLRGTVAKVVHFGVFVTIEDWGFGLVRAGESDGRPALTSQLPEGVELGAEVSVVVTHIDRPNRRVSLDWPSATPSPGHR
ncbi:S1 RNA-binding domain-containing protein [Streptomyces cavernicola]|uniref:S1 RNA-binding domain-containing protein n=1 Tax=Streptomyces cavernicola TaxID=3043613 RepID=A0ABT6SD32_9ACTN|nr:S1 RNA-binding domain-containing protein [Streptomyces sp. B-S-A6]MDI3405176.1 S1 RNA-binding domain-containing protein [Streptomyces sp. B-S-A6]